MDGFAIRCMAILPTRQSNNVTLLIRVGASNEVRTRDLDLGKVALYQLSYTRIGQRCCVVMARILQNQQAYASTLCR